MAQTKVLIDYDLQTHEIRRIIHPEDDSQIPHHKEEPGWGRLEAHHDEFPLTDDGKPLYSLKHCSDAVEKHTGKRPPNADGAVWRDESIQPTPPQGPDNPSLPE